jgi:hypothetical protein
MPNKIRISPAQGLLLLLEHYKDDEIKVRRLKDLYLSGAKNPAESDEIKVLLADDALASYEVLYDPKTINDDPTRRYFETHLAYQTLRNGLKDIDADTLRDHVEKMKAMIPAECGLLEEYVLPIFNGEYRSHDPDFDIEFASYFKNIKEGKLFGDLAPADKEKLELLLQSAFLGVIVMDFQEFPIDIYGTGIYKKDARGKELVEGQKTTRNPHLGLMKGHMPLAADDIAHLESATPYVKPSDQSRYQSDAEWVKRNFEGLVHPFSNSISGTMLAQLRNLAKLQDRGEATFSASSEKMAKFCQLFTSALLFGSGGHTLHEFTAPISLPEVQEEFSSTPGMDKLTLDTLFHKDNEAAFDKALQETIAYNNMLLLRRKLHAELPKRVRPEIAPSLDKIQAKRELIDSLQMKRDYYRQKVEKQFLSGWRSAAKKVQLIQAGIDQAIKLIKEDKILEAQETIRRLQTSITSQFGTHNSWGKVADSYKIVKAIENELESYQRKIAISELPRTPPKDKEEKSEGEGDGEGELEGPHMS